jgi:hypothetical protein
MDYKIALSPDLNINSQDFVAMWNSDPKSLDTGKAEEIKHTKEAFACRRIKRSYSSRQWLEL